MGAAKVERYRRLVLVFARGDPDMWPVLAVWRRHLMLRGCRMWVVRNPEHFRKLFRDQHRQKGFLIDHVNPAAFPIARQVARLAFALHHDTCTLLLAGPDNANTFHDIGCFVVHRPGEDLHSLFDHVAGLSVSVAC